MKKRTIYFIGGLPRSGSTLLTNLLAQNPKFHVTSTSALLHLMNIVKDNWTDLGAFKATGIENSLPRIRKSLRGMLLDFYNDEFEKDLIVFQKDRAIMNNIEFMEEVLDAKIKIITCVRPIKDITSSFEKLYLKNPLIKSSLYSNDIARISTYSRAADLLSKTGVIGVVWNMIMDVINRGYADRLLVVPFDNLVTDPVSVLDGLHGALDIERYDYKLTDFEQLICEDDSVYGIPGLHDIQTDKIVNKESDALNILGAQIVSEIETNFNNELWKQEK